MRQSVTSIAQGMVLTAKQSKHIAESIGKPYPTMMRELNPYDHSAKLGAETLLEIMKVTHNIDALQYMASELGYSLSSDAHAESSLSSSDASLSSSEVSLSSAEEMMEASQKS